MVCVHKQQVICTREACTVPKIRLSGLGIEQNGIVFFKGRTNKQDQQELYKIYQKPKTL